MPGTDGTPRAGPGLAALAAVAAAIWLAFDASGLDMAVSRVFFDAASGTFLLRDNWWLAAAGHTGLKRLSVAFWCLLAFGAAWVPARWAALQPALREAAISVAAAALLVLWLRGLSAHSCPWDVAGLGGSAQHYPLFGSLPENPGPGACLPAAHASSGFALFGLYFALRECHPKAARAVLAAAWALGLVAGAVQIARGAHFASHVMWTAWIAWTSSRAMHIAASRLRGG
ncbi:MAG: phosphatase PAP2 family protein [Burkholderiales bacterium]